MKKLNQKIYIVVFSSFLVFSLFNSCASSGSGGKKIKYKESAYREAVMTNDYEKALAMLYSINPEKITIAQRIDMGLLQYFLGDYKASSATMKGVLQKIDEAQISQKEMESKVGGFYAPTFYENLLADSFDALNYYKQGDLDSAFSRTTRAYNKLNTYNVSEIRQEVMEPEKSDDPVDESTAKSVSQALHAVGIPGATIIEFFAQFKGMKLPAKPTEQDIYKGSAFAAYIRMVMTAINNSDRDENVEKVLKQLSANVETDVASMASSKKGRIEVLALTGSINQKKDEVIFIDAQSLVKAIAEVYAAKMGVSSYLVTRLFTGDNSKMGYNIHYPVYEKQEEGKVPTVTKVTLNDGTSKEAILLEDFDLALLQNVNMTARKTAKKNLAFSLSTKTPIYIAQTAAYITAAKASSESKYGGELLLAVAVKAFVAAIANVDPKADLRQCMAIPSKAYCAGFTVEPGTYSVTVEYSNGASQTIENVVVAAGKPVLVESVCK